MRQVLLFMLAVLCMQPLAAMRYGDTPVVHNCSLRSRWLMLSAGYRLPVINRQVINSGHGPTFELALNLGKLAPGNAMIGLYAGWSFMDRLWSTRFDPEFTTAYAASINSSDFSPDEKKLVDASAELFRSKHGSSPTAPGCEMRSFHNSTLYYGVFFRLPMQQIRLVKLYAGTTRTHYQGGKGLVTNGDYNIIQLRRPILGAELVIANPFNTPPVSLLRRLDLSLFFEYAFLNCASLYFDDGDASREILLEGFMKEDFMNSYSSEWILGVKLALLLY